MDVQASESCIIRDAQVSETRHFPLWTEPLAGGEELNPAKQLVSVLGMDMKLRTDLRENCFGDKEVAILAFSL